MASGIIKPYWAFSDIDRHSLNALYNWGLIEKRVNGAVLNSAGSDGLFFPNGKHGFQIRLTPKGMAARENCFYLKASTFNHARKLAGKRFLKKLHHPRPERNVYEFEDYYFEHDDEAR